MKLNLANKLTLLRVLMIPIFVVFMSCRNIPYNFLWAFIVFVLASLTDWLDGYVARKYNMITNLGKFLDPLADKLLVISALICFLEMLWVIPAFMVHVIIAREFIVSGFRLAVVSKNNNAVIAADIWGKIKTAVTMITICAILLNLVWSSFGPVPFFLSIKVNDILLWICTILTVISGFTMIWKNRKLFGE